MKQLQVALDVESTEKALEVLEKVADYVDIIELGTPLMIHEGKKVISAIKEKYPDKIIFSDIKIMDGGSIMADIVFEAGADMVSVLAAANDQTIIDVIDTAKKYRRKVLVDMVAIEDLKERASKVNEWKPDYISVHIGTDVQDGGADPVEEVKRMGNLGDTLIAAAGGISLDNFEEACKSNINDIIVGGSIYNAKSPEKIAKEMFNIINKYR